MCKNSFCTSTYENCSLFFLCMCVRVLCVCVFAPSSCFAMQLLKYKSPIKLSLPCDCMFFTTTFLEPDKNHHLLEISRTLNAQYCQIPSSSSCVLCSCSHHAVASLQFSGTGVKFCIYFVHVDRTSCYIWQNKAAYFCKVSDLQDFFFHILVPLVNSLVLGIVVVFFFVQFAFVCVFLFVCLFDFIVVVLSQQMLAFEGSSSSAPILLFMMQKRKVEPFLQYPHISRYPSGLLGSLQ